MPIPGNKAIGNHGHTDDHNSMNSVLTDHASLVTATRLARNLRDVVTPSGTDDTAAVNAALADFDSDGGGLLRIPRDNWKFTGSTGLALTGTVNPIHIVADDGATFDMTDSTATIGMSLGGSLGASSALTGDADRFDETIACALSVSAGDIIRIQSTDLFVTLPKGELAEVVSSDGSTITLRSGLWDSYAASTTTVRLVNAPRVSVEGLTILRDSNHMGLQIQYARDVMLAGLYAEGARERLFYIDHIMGATVDNCRGRDFWYSGTGTSYGLVIGSGQGFMQIGNDFRGGRHALTHGGTFPSRDIQIIGGFFDSYAPAGQACVDFHNQNENVRISSASILNGLFSGASNIDVVDTTIRTANHASAPNAVQLSIYRSCDYIKLRNCDVQAGGTNTDALVLNTRTGATATTVGRVELTGRFKGNGTGTGVRVVPNSSSDNATTITDFRLNGDVESGVGVYFSKATAAEIAVTSARIGGRVAGLTGTAVLALTTGGGRFTFDGAEVVTTDASNATGIDVATATGPVTIRNSHILCDGVTGYRMEFGSGRLEITDTVIDGFGTNGGIGAASASEALISNLTRLNCSGTPSLPARHYSRINVSGKVTTQGSAAPVAGTWAVGDTCENSAPASAETSLWICTVAGTPGTWAATDTIA